MFISLNFFPCPVSQWIFLAILLLLGTCRTASTAASLLLGSSVPATNPAGTDSQIRNHRHLFDTHTTSSIEWNADIPPFLFQSVPFLSLDMTAHCYEKCHPKEAMEGSKHLSYSWMLLWFSIFCCFYNDVAWMKPETGMPIFVIHPSHNASVSPIFTNLVIILSLFV